jgi:transcriptional regulator with XRE-family HTH domain
MNTEWFRDVMAAKKLSQRRMAALMDLDPAAVSLMLRGQRKMTNAEAHKMSQLLGVKTTEVLRQAGVAVTDDVRNVPISAWVDKDGVVTLFPEKTHDKVVGPADCPAGTYAVQVRAPGLPQDGWLMFVSPSKVEAADNLDKLCLVASRMGTTSIAVLRRGYRAGAYNLIAWPSLVSCNDALVAWCSPVLWIKP